MCEHRWHYFLARGAVQTMGMRDPQSCCWMVLHFVKWGEGGVGEIE